MNPYRQAPVSPPWWRRLLCSLGYHLLELVYIEKTEEDDIWHHRCPHCGQTSKVADYGDHWP